jgi:hypothetical protein
MKDEPRSNNIEYLRAMTDILNRLHEAAGDSINDLYSEAAVEIEKLRNLAIDLMYLLDQLPIKNVQQAAVRTILRNQCEKFIYRD